MNSEHMQFQQQSRSRSQSAPPSTRSASQHLIDERTNRIPQTDLSVIEAKIDQIITEIRKFKNPGSHPRHGRPLSNRILYIEATDPGVELQSSSIERLNPRGLKQ